MLCTVFTIYTVFEIQLILHLQHISICVCSHMWLVASASDRTGLEPRSLGCFGRKLELGLELKTNRRHGLQSLSNCGSEIASTH